MSINHVNELIWHFSVSYRKSVFHVRHFLYNWLHCTIDNRCHFIFLPKMKYSRDNSSGVILRYRMNSITFEFPARFVRRYLRRDLVWGNESLEVASDKDRDAT